VVDQHAGRGARGIGQGSSRSVRPCSRA
jgi:hypothetical protein